MLTAQRTTSAIFTTSQPSPLASLPFAASPARILPARVFCRGAACLPRTARGCAQLVRTCNSSLLFVLSPFPAPSSCYNATKEPSHGMFVVRLIGVLFLVVLNGF